MILIPPTPFIRRTKAKLPEAAPPPALLNVVDVTVLDIGDQALTWVFDGPTGIDGSTVPVQLTAKGTGDADWVAPDSIAAFDDSSVTLLYSTSSGFDGTGTWDVESQPDGMNALAVPESGTITGPVPPPPPPLNLVSADYGGGRYITLTFDRAVIIGDDFDAGQVQVNNSAAGTLYIGGAGNQPTDESVLVYMDLDEPSSDAGVFLNASGTTRIVAVNDGGTWAGAIALPLPFP